jgi:hypothetical protein
VIGAIPFQAALQAVRELDGDDRAFAELGET